MSSPATPTHSPPGGAAAALGQAWRAAALRRVLFSTRDRDCAQAMVGRVFRPHRLEPACGEAVDATMEHLDAGLLGISRLGYGASVEIVPGSLESFYLLQIPVQGAAEIETAGERFVSDARCASLISPDQALHMRWRADNAQVCVRLEAEVLRRFVSAWTGRAAKRLPVFAPRVSLDAQPLLQDLLLTLIRVAEQGTVTALPSAQLQYRLLALMLGQLPHDAAAQLNGSSPPVAPRSVRLVEDYLIEHCAEPLTPEQLAALAGVSVRSLFLGFQRYRGVSPMRLLREVRLRRVHEELLRAAPGTRVTDVALRWGFCHLGRFGQDYQRAFGESPSKTLRAAQG